MGEMLTRQQMRDSLEKIGEAMYHHRHPFHLKMHSGELTREQLQAWALNRFYYQSIIPIKDSIIMSKSHNTSFRLAWRKRIVDHDGDTADPEKPGGIEKWIQLAVATGLDACYVRSFRGVLPGVRYAVDSYVALVRKGSLLEAVSSSLTELFAGKLIALRVDAMREHYPWLVSGLAYFQARLAQAPEDAAFAFDYAFTHSTTPELQAVVLECLRMKCELLWAQLDALYYSYVDPGNIPPSPGVFRPGKARQ
jgi:coenzyme PQQ biosynthesis protein C